MALRASMSILSVTRSFLSSSMSRARVSTSARSSSSSSPVAELGGACSDLLPVPCQPPKAQPVSTQGPPVTRPAQRPPARDYGGVTKRTLANETDRFAGNSAGLVKLLPSMAATVLD